MPDFRFAPLLGGLSRVPVSSAVPVGDACSGLRAAPDAGVAALPEPWRTLVQRAMAFCRMSPPPPGPSRTGIIPAGRCYVDPVRLEALAVQLDVCGQHAAATEVRKVFAPSDVDVGFSGVPVELYTGGAIAPCAPGVTYYEWYKEQDADNGRALAREDLRRARTGVRVYMPDWIRTAGPAYFFSYQAEICNGGGQFRPATGPTDGPDRYLIEVPFTLEGSPSDIADTLSVGAPFGGARPFSGYRAPFVVSNIPAAPTDPIFGPSSCTPGVVYADLYTSPDATNGARLAQEDVRRARTGAIVWMPEWIRTAGPAYQSGYQTGVCNYGGQFVRVGSRTRIVPQGAVAAGYLTADTFTPDAFGGR